MHTQKSSARNKLKDFLDSRVEKYNQPAFIASDPVSIPHFFKKQADREIAGFFAAVFSWGNRTTIIRKSAELMQRMDNQPHDFVLHHSEKDLHRLLGFKHRTFTDTDLLYFIHFLNAHFSGTHPRRAKGMQTQSLESAFSTWMEKEEDNVGSALRGFYHYFTGMEDMPPRTRKHIATPDRKSTCKRLNMFLRWMVRNDRQGVDFGHWKKIRPHQLICPVDLHVARVARRFGLLQRKQTDWLAALELTQALRGFDSQDPVKYDFALFGMGIDEKY